MWPNMSSVASPSAMTMATSGQTDPNLANLIAAYAPQQASQVPSSSDILSQLSAPQTTNPSDITLQSALVTPSPTVLPGQTTASISPALSNLLYAQNLQGMYDATSDIG
jgi:hypothetical protein